MASPMTLRASGFGHKFADADPQDLLLLDDLLGIADAKLAQTGIDPDARRTRLTALINAMSLARDPARGLRYRGRALGR